MINITENGNYNMAGKKVLVVDDDVKTVELVKLYLNRDGYRVITAYNGTDALKMAREERPDLIVLDLHPVNYLGSFINFFHEK